MDSADVCGFSFCRSANETKNHCLLKKDSFLLLMKHFFCFWGVPSTKGKLTEDFTKARRGLQQRSEAQPRASECKRPMVQGEKLLLLFLVIFFVFLKRPGFCIFSGQS